MAKFLDTVYSLWLREILRFTKSKSRLIGTGGQPLIWLAIVGVGIGSVLTGIGGTSYITYIAPGVIGMTLLFTSIFAGINVIMDKQFGFLKEILVSPVSRVAIVVGKIAGSATVSLITALIVFVIIIAVGVIPISSLTPLGLAEAIIFMVLIASIFVSIGLVIASYVNNLEGFQVIMNFLILPLFFLSGALFPLTTAPEWMQTIAGIDPLRYGVDGMRGALIGAGNYPVWLDLTVVFAISVVLLLIADRAFRKMQAK